MVVTRKNSEASLKPKFSKCSKLKRAISHKILRKSSNKHISEKNNKSSVLLLSMISTTEKNNFKMKNENSSLYSDDYCPGFLLQPLDLVIQEAKHQLMHEKLCEKEMKNFDVGKYSDKNISASRDSEDEDIYEDMEILQTYFENIYTGDYLEMGLV